MFPFHKRWLHFRFSKMESAVLCEIFVERNCGLLSDSLNKAVRECPYSWYSHFGLPQFLCKTENLITMKNAQNQCVIRIINPAEGCQFLLVECAYFLDEEDLVDDIDDRIFVANGKIHLVRDKTVVKEFHKHVSDNATEMKESVQDCEKGELI
ncbi:hypothetical protein ACOME3_000222 [Neoechinorhynchus agilis]